MLELSNDDRRLLREAIQSAYSEPDDLKIFVREELGKNLADIAGSGVPSRTIVFKLIEWAIAKGHTDDLILALQRDTQNRPDIQQLCARVLRQRLVLNAAVTASEESMLPLEPAAWDINIETAELELFLPKQFTYEADVGALQRGLERANAVCKITFADRSPTESGTGVLIAADLVLTNYHVLSLQDGAELNAIAQTAQFEFGYVSTPFGESRCRQYLQAVADHPVVAASPIGELDYALIRIKPTDDFKTSPVPLNATAVLGPRSPLNLLQHPEGEAMKVSLSANGVVKTQESKGLVLYVNPTKGGSSGSPCFDEHWQLVALHHKSLQTSFGSVREGILWSAIHTQISSVYPQISSVLTAQ
jgi:V8-like Glu-specific endopeptidase